MIRTLLFFLLLIISFYTGAQKLLKGAVVDEKGAPVPKASVFLNNTSVGTTADEGGKFALYIPQGKFELIVSSVGFVTANQSINAVDVPDFITIKLSIKAPELESVIIEPYLKNGWQRWGQFFLNNFIGESDLAGDCKIINYDVIRFRESRKSGEITATAPEPLLIENKALGYRIRYQLESFTYTQKDHYIFFTGYPFFEKMEGSDHKQRNWAKARGEAYYGSQLHFLRSVYLNKVLPEGFEVRRLQRIINSEKQRVKALYKGQMVTVTDNGNSKQVKFQHSDSSSYYDDILSQPDYKERVGATILSGDSIAYAIDSVTAGLDFTDYLLVIYKNKKVRPEYLRQFPKNSPTMMSQLFLLNQLPIQVQANGMYYNPADMLTLGYWAWSEKICAMLPFDYKPAPH